MASAVDGARKLAEACVKAIDPSFSIMWRAGKKGYTWPGTGVLRMSETSVFKSLHDVAHLMIAPQERWWLPEWGLGADPMRESPAQNILTSKEAQKEEDRACDLQWALAAFSGGVRAARYVEEYVNLPMPPSEARIKGMVRRYPYLPASFAKKAIEVRRKRMKAIAKEVRSQQPKLYVKPRVYS